MKTSLAIAAIAALSFSLAQLPAVAKDWPAYRGVKSDGKSDESILRAWPSEGLKNRWRVPLTDGLSSFSTGDGKAYTLVQRDVEGVKREVIAALDASTGKEVWAAPLQVAKYDGGGGDGTADNRGGDGPRSTPTFADGKVYVLSANLKLACFDAKTGKQVWIRDIMAEHSGRNIRWQNAASPLLDGDKIFAAGGGAGESLLAFDRQSGKTVWKSQDELITHATPTIAEIHGKRQVIFFTQSGLVALDVNTGELLWKHPFRFNVSTAASPVVSGDIVYCAAGYGVGSTAVKIAKKGAGFAATELWRVTGNKIANHWSTPVAHNGYLYGMFSFKEYGSGALKCVELATGNEVWAQAGFGAGNVILVDGQILALSDAGQLVLVKPDPKGYRETARMKAVQGKCWSTPIVSHGKVLVRSTREAAAFDIAPAVSSLK